MPVQRGNDSGRMYVLRGERASKTAFSRDASGVFSEVAFWPRRLGRHLGPALALEGGPELNDGGGRWRNARRAACVAGFFLVVSVE